MIEFTIENGNWVASQFFSYHNHELVKKNQQDMLRSQRHMDESRANVIETIKNASIRASNYIFLHSKQGGGAQKVGFLKSDYDSFLWDKRKVILEVGDT